MSTFSTLNDYSADDVVLTVDDQLMLLPEGANVRMPLMAWTPIHDIGDPFDGTGVQITHTFYPGSITMSNGQILTYDEYLGFVENKPSITAVGNIQIVNTPVNFGTESILYHTNTANGYVNVDMEPSGFDIADDFCFECWYWPTAVQSGFDWIFSYGGFKFGLSLLNALELNLTIEGTTYQYYLRSPGTYPEFLNQWHHFAVVRLNGQVRTFVDGVLYGSSVASTTDYSHYAPDITIGKNSGSGSIHGYIDGARFSNVARYNTTGSIIVPTTAWDRDNNTVFQIEAVDAAVVDTANIYALNRVLNIPALQLKGGSANVSLTNTSGNTWEIKYIHTPEDYLAGDVYLDYPRDYSGIGNAEVNGTLDWTTNIKNLDVLDYDFTFNVHLELEDKSELSNLYLGDLPYSVYGNTLNDTSNVITLFNNTTQTTQILDNENPDSDSYTVVITTQHHASLIVLDTTSTADIYKKWYYEDSIPGGNGQLTLQGKKATVNEALLNLKLTKNDNAPAVINADRPNSRNAAAVLYDVIQTWPPVENPATFLPSTIITNQTADGPRVDIPYCVVPNNQSSGVATRQQLNLIIPNTAYLPGYIGVDSSWTGCRWASFPSAYTHEYWIWIDDATKNCNIHTAGVGLSLYEGKLWMAWDWAIPGICGVPNTVANKPRRIEHNTTVVSGQWYHIAQVCDAGVYKFYVNGINDSTVYTTGDTTTVVATVASGFAPINSPDIWSYGGYTPMVSVDSTTATTYKLPGFAGRFAQIRVSKTARYTENFTPPASLYFNDSDTIYLHQFNVTLAQDDNTLPQFNGAVKQLTWSITNPNGVEFGPLSQTYYPQFTNPIWEALDVNYVVPASGKYRVAYAGRDLANNPMFVYGFKDDSNGLTVKANKLNVATGNIIYGPNQQLSTSTPASTVSVITNNEGVNLRESLIQTDVPIAITSTNNCLTGTINLENGSIVLTGTVSTGQASTVETTLYNYKSLESPVFLGVATANVTASVFDNASMPYNTNTTKATNTNIATELSIVGFPGVSQNRVLKLATGLQPSTFVPRYNLTVTAGVTDPSSGNFGAGLMMPSLTAGAAGQYKIRSISINQDRSDPVSVNYNNDNRFLWCVRNRYQIGTINEQIYLLFRSGRLDDAGYPYMALGQEISMYTDPNNPLRVGGFDIVPGATKNKAWFVFNKEFTTNGSSTGQSNNTAAGLWYMGINISDSYSITFDTAVQVIDPDQSGAIYTPSLSAQSVSIGAYTYIYAVVGSSSSDQPYPVALKIPN